MKLSIIIPCYNAENYAPQLLSKLEKLIGDNKEIEVIAVNDGSKDKTLDVLLDIAKNFNSLTIVDQENGGPAVARNSGFNKATGEYVWYVDVDDDIAENSLDVLCAEIEKNPSDVILFNYKETDMQGKPYHDVKDWGYKMDSLVTGLEAYAQNTIPAFLWNRIIRREVLVENHVTFGIIPEDEDYLLETYFYAKTLRFIPNVLYRYKIMDISFSRGNVKTFIKYYNGYYDILEKYLSRVPQFKNDGFWTTFLFNCCKNLAVNYNRVLLMNADVKDNRRQFHARMSSYIKSYMTAGCHFVGKDAKKLHIIKTFPWLLDMVAYIKYKRSK